MHVLQVLAFVLFLAAALVAAIGKQWPVALLAAGLAAYLAPVALELT